MSWGHNCGEISCPRSSLHVKGLFSPLIFTLFPLFWKYSEKLPSRGLCISRLNKNFRISLAAPVWFIWTGLEEGWVRFNYFCKFTHTSQDHYGPPTIPAWHCGCTDLSVTILTSASSQLQMSQNMWESWGAFMSCGHLSLDPEIKLWPSRQRRDMGWGVPSVAEADFSLGLAVVRSSSGQERLWVCEN